jgi:glucan phosphoethanolaminetransferase (alkaline phosphatase superfamily)
MPLNKSVKIGLCFAGLNLLTYVMTLIFPSVSNCDVLTNIEQCRAEENSFLLFIGFSSKLLYVLSLPIAIFVLIIGTYSAHKKREPGLSLSVFVILIISLVFNLNYLQSLFF